MEVGQTARAISAAILHTDTAARLLILTVVLGTALLCCTGAVAQTVDPKPPQVSVGYLFSPSPLVQDSSTHLVYEMRVTNYSELTYAIESLKARAGQRIFTFSGDDLKKMIRILCLPPAKATRTLEAGRTAIIYLTLDLGRSPTVPNNIEHTLQFTGPDGKPQRLQVLSLAVSHQRPLVVAAPLRGPNWIAGDSSHNAPDAAHRRTILLTGGQPFLAQRYAIDWVQYPMSSGLAVTFSGAEDQNASYFCYDAPVLSVAPGKVVGYLDGVPENVPHPGKYAVDINFVNAGGNYLVVDIGGGRYAFYAHMRPLTVKLGDHVTVGQVLGRIGNTGSSTEPHPHMHIVDQPSFLAGHGIPYAFTRYKASQSSNITEKPGRAMQFRDFGPLTVQTNEYPANNAAVEFP